jgi:hypothetical protein
MPIAPLPHANGASFLCFDLTIRDLEITAKVHKTRHRTRTGMYACVPCLSRLPPVSFLPVVPCVSRLPPVSFYRLYADTGGSRSGDLRFSRIPQKRRVEACVSPHPHAFLAGHAGVGREGP